jgi:AI-2 transport protein TqsA
MCQAVVRRLFNPSERCHVRKVARLLAQALSLSPTVLFIGFIFWAWLLGGPGAFLAAPLTIFLVLMLDTFPETRWLASVMGVGPPDSEVPAPEEVVESNQLTPRGEA